MQTLTKQTIKIFLKHARVYWLSGIILYLGAILGTIANVIGPIFYKQFFDTLVEPGDVETKAPILIKIILLVMAVHSISWLFWRISTFIASYFQTRIMIDLAKTSFAYLHKHSSTYFNNNFVGSLVKRVNRFSNSFEGVSDIFAWDLFPLVVETTFISIILFAKNTTLGFIILIWITIFSAVNYAFSRYKLKYDIRQSVYDSKTTGVLADSITNHGNIKLFSAYDRERKYYGDQITKTQKLRRFRWDLENTFEAVQAILMIALEFGVFYFAIILWQKELITIGDFVLLQAYVITIFNRFWGFGRIIRRLYENLANAVEMTEILETPHEIIDKKRAKEIIVKKGKIEFKDVYFCYNKTRSILKKFNLKIKAGERVAFVGPSGAGKSTVAKMLLRIHDISRGSILIDRQKIKDVTQDSLHESISLVPQDTILFHRTLMENIRYGKPKATDEEVIKASKLAHCHEFISEFPEQYETYVGERGVKLSGGERQRVAIARAILKNAPILILDEATSSLDSESEGLIQDALDTLMKEKTVIVIAHRLSTIMKMDRIVVLDRGKIVEQGSHKELLKKKGGIYKKLWKLQVGGFIG